jgi:putative transcription antitermination factor YqgF
MNYIAIDLGNKRVGIAISVQNIAFPEAVITRTEVVVWLKKYFKNNKEIENIVVGLPYDLYGKDTRQLEKTQKFIEKLENIFPEKNILGHDERFSSFQAADGFGDHRDDIAAQCILQSYIDSKNK